MEKKGNRDLTTPEEKTAKEENGPGGRRGLGQGECGNSKLELLF